MDALSLANHLYGGDDILTSIGYSAVSSVAAEASWLELAGGYILEGIGYALVCIFSFFN